MYQVIPLRPCDYLHKVTIKINIATDKGNSRNEQKDEQKDEIGVVVQSWFWVQVEVMAW